MRLQRAAFATVLLISTFSFSQQAGLGSRGFPEVDYQESASSVTQRGAKRDPNFTIKVNAQVVAVDVVAVDSKGNAVTDLKPEELVLQEDGKKQSISAFKIEKRGEGNIGTLATLHKAAKNRPPSVMTNFDSTVASVPENGCTILLIDELNTTLFDQAFTREHLEKFIASLEPNQPVAIYVLGDSLLKVQGFTSDIATLKDAIKGYAGHPTMLQPVSGQNSQRPLAASLTPPHSKNQAGAQENIRFFEAELLNAETDHRVIRTVKALAALSRQVAAVNGRKSLIWLSGGFPIEIGPAQTAPDGKAEYATGYPRSYDSEVEGVGRILASANVVLYPVDARGLMSGAFDASMNGFENGHQVSTSAVSVYTSQISKNLVDITQPQRTMAIMADLTGGRAFYNGNDIEHELKSAMTDGDSFYSLSFHPRTTAADGSYHTIKLATTRNGVHLRYRKGYYALDADERDVVQKQAQKLELEQALLEQRSLSTGLPLMAQVDAAKADVIDLWIHGGSLSILNEAKDNSSMVRFELAVVSFDADGKILTKKTVIVGTKLRTDKLNAVLNDGLSQNVKFERKPEARRLRMAIRDIPSGRIGTIDIPLNSTSASAATTADVPKP